MMFKCVYMCYVFLFFPFLEYIYCWYRMQVSKTVPIAIEYRYKSLSPTIIRFHRHIHSHLRTRIIHCDIAKRRARFTSIDFNLFVNFFFSSQLVVFASRSCGQCALAKNLNFKLVFSKI